MKNRTQKEPTNRKGRKSKLTKVLIKQIAECLKAHNTKKDTCHHVGIHPATLYDWLSAGEVENSGLKADLSDAVKRAQAISKTELVSQIAEDPSWQSKAWLLERMHPQEYGRRQLIAHAGADGESPVAITSNAPVVQVVIQDGGDPWDIDEDAK